MTASGARGLTPNKIRLLKYLNQLTNENLTWAQQQAQWIYVGSTHGYGDDDCPCGKEHIVELCQIEHRSKPLEVILGNCCVKDLCFGDPSIEDSDAVIRQHKVLKLGEVSTGPGLALLAQAHRLGDITDWEYGFAVDTAKKRSLSAKQRAIRTRIKDKILNSLSKRHARLTKPTAQSTDDLRALQLAFSTKTLAEQYAANGGVA